MSKPKLTKDDFCRIAKKLKCDVAAVKAVAHVESRGEGFYPNGFPTILFERHKFRKFTRGKYNSSHPHLSGSQGGYGKAGPNQQAKFSEAFALDPEAAMESCSWGKFQVMGFNWDDLGYDSIHEFVDRMKMGEGEHLEAFARFVIKNGLRDELQRLDFTTFARVYNGEAYKINKYDDKMRAAYKNFKTENIECDEVQSVNPFADLADDEIELEIPISTAAPLSQPAALTGTQNVEQRVEPATPAAVDATGITQNAENIVNTAPIEPPFTPETMVVSAPPPTGFIGKLKAQIAALLAFIGGGAGLKEYLNVELGEQTVTFLKYLVPTVLGLGFFGFLVWFVTEKVVGYQTLKLKATLRTDPTKHNVVIMPGEDVNRWYHFWR